MKKFLALVLAAMMLFSAASALADGIKIGFIGPLTGAAAVYGNAAKNGAQIAVDEINAAGILEIEYNAQDDEHDAEKSVNAYNNLWDWGAQMIVGCVTTSPCIAVAAEAYNDRMFLLTPSASSTEVTANNDNVFQVCFTDPAQGTLSAQYIAENAIASKVAVIYNNADAYSTGIYQTFKDEAEARGLELVSVTTFTDETTDFTVQVTSAKEAGAELVFLPIYYTPASMIFQTAANMGYQPLYFGVDGMDGILTLEGFDTALAEGVMLLTPFAADAQDELTQQFVSTYMERYGETPNQFAADGYDAVYALVAVALNKGITAETSTEDACELLIEGITEIELTGLTGTMTWSENGEVTKTPTAVVIENGVYVKK